MLIQPKFLFIYSFFFQPIVYIVTKEYKRGIIMHFVGIMSIMLAISVMQIGFIVGADTMLMLIIGILMIFGSYGLLVFDCILVTRKTRVLASR